MSRYHQLHQETPQFATTYDLIYALKYPTPSPPTLQLGDEKITTLEILAEILILISNLLLYPAADNRGWILIILFHL